MLIFYKFRLDIYKTIVCVMRYCVGKLQDVMLAIRQESRSPDQVSRIATALLCCLRSFFASEKQHYSHPPSPTVMADKSGV